MKKLYAKEKSSSEARSFKRPAAGKVRQEIIYPDSDGKPMAENTKQFDWIVKIKENLERMFRSNPDVFIAGDLFWYPVKGNNKIRTAPDAMVVLGRPKGHRMSYKMWEEANIAPQVVFEILSPGNSAGEMKRKLNFYQKYGVQEYYIYDPDDIELTGWILYENQLTPIENMQGWTSPLLKIRFELRADDLIIFNTDGEKFLSTLELVQLAEDAKKRETEERQRAESERQRAESERQRADSERQRAEKAQKREIKERQKAQVAQKKAESERQRADSERQRADRLAAKLRELGIESAD